MKKTWLLLVSTLFFIATLVSCEIGLGPAVDVQAPTISIEYPEISSIIRDSFVLKGSCGDDYGIEKVSVQVYRTDTGSPEAVGTYEADINDSQTAWSVELNKYDPNHNKYNGWEWADGTYEISVTTKDKSGKISQRASRTYDIDNTAPLLILSSPGIDDIRNATGYGTALTIKGNISDLHTANRLVMKVYKSNEAGEKISFIGEYEETNLEKISDDGIIFAQKDGAEDKDARYKQMYDTELGGNQYYICEFTVYDNAKTYKDSARSSDEGNSTSAFYFTDDVYNAWLNPKVGLGYSDARKIISSTFTGSYVSSPIETPSVTASKIDRENLIVHNNGKEASDYVRNNLSVRSAVFSLNQDANPKYTVSGYSYNFDKPDVVLSVQSKTLINVQFTPGRNGTFIEPKTIKVYQFGPFKTLSEENAKAIYRDPANYAEKNPDISAVIGNNDSYKASSVDSFVMEANLGEKLTGGQYYIIAATGKDKDGNIADANGYYIVKADTTAIPPKVTWWNVEENGDHGAYINSVDSSGVTGTTDLTFSGYVSSNVDLKSFEFVAEAKADKNSNPLRVLKGSVADKRVKLIPTDVEGQYIWTFSLKDCEDFILPPAGATYIDTITIKAVNIADTETTVERIFTVDTKEPEIRITSVTPVVEKEAAGVTNYYVNGKIKVSGNISESNLQKVYYEIWSNGDSAPAYTSPDLGSSYFTIGETIDTTAAAYGCADEKSLNIIFYAEDKAGNKSHYSIKEYNLEKEYVVSQATDNPVFTVSNSNCPDTEEGIESFFDNSGNNKLNVSITDDDGLDSVTVTVTNKDGSALAAPIAGKPLSFRKGSTSVSLNYVLPSKDGIYKVSFTATDSTYEEASAAVKPYRKTVLGPFYVGVDTGAPEVEITSHGTGIDTLGAGTMTSGFDFTGTAEDNNSIKEIKITAAVKGQPDKVWTTANDGDGITVSGNTWKKHFTKTDLPDATYKITVTATDDAGKTGSTSKDFVIDTVDPVVRSVTFDNPIKKLGANNDESWYNSSQVKATVITEKDTSGVTLVEYSFGGVTGWNSFKKESDVDGVTTWTANVIGLEAGANKIYVRATDTANNSAFSNPKFLTIYSDTKTPEVSLVSVDGVPKENLPNVKSVNADANTIEFVVDVNDIETGKTAATSSGIDTIYVTKIGNKIFDTAIPGTLIAGTTQYKFTLTKNSDEILNQLVSGIVYVKATDKLGNASVETNLFEISSDVTPPVITIKSVNPVVKNGTDKYVNGTIIVGATVNEMNLKEVWYEIESDGVKLKNTDGTTRFDLPADADLSNPEISIDTTKCTDGKSINVIIHAEDNAGNSSEKNVTENFAGAGGVAYIVNQSTDKPGIRITTGVINTNYELPMTKDAVTSYYSNAGNDSINGSITDDDGIAAISVTVKKEDGIVVVNNQAITDFTPNSTSASINYKLPEVDGYYTVTFTVKDNTYADAPSGYESYRINEMTPFWVGVDNASPELAFTEANCTQAGAVKTDIVLKGTVNDNTGIAGLKIVSNGRNYLGVPKETTWEANKLYDGAATPKLTLDALGNWVITCETSEVDDGTYTFKVTATDNAKKTTSLERTFTKDTVAPSFKTVTVSTNPSYTDSNSIKWYGTSQISIAVKATDLTSSVSSVEYSTEADVWNTLNKGITEGKDSNWTGSVSCKAEGLNTIKLRATDEAGNKVEYATPLKVYIDTKAPSTMELVSVGGDTGFSGKKYVNKNIVSDSNKVVFVVNAADSGTADKSTGIGSVKLTKIGNTELNIAATPVAGETGHYTITIPRDKYTTGSVFVEATDNAGNAGQETALFQIENDTEAPSVVIKTVTPSVEKSGKKLNGKVAVNASIADPNLKNVKYKVYSDGVLKTTSTDLGAVYTFVEEIDTTGYENGKSIKVEIIAEDEAGNSTTKDTTKDFNGNVDFVVDQSTDKPVFTPSNYTERATAAAIESGDWFDNKGNNKLIASVSDDDGLAGLTVTVTKADGTALSPAINNAALPFTANSTSAAINYILPSTDGIYKVVFTATDNTYDGASAENKAYRTTQTSPFFVGVDTAAPTVSITSHGTGTNTVGSSLGLTAGKLVFSGKAADNNKISKIEIKASKAGSSDKTWTWERGAASNAVTFTDGTWTKEFTVGSGKDLPDGEYTVSVTVTDPAGKTGSAERSFIIDTVNPTLDSVEIDDTTKQTGTSVTVNDVTNIWYKTSQIGIMAKTSDATSGVSVVEYSTDGGTNWSSLTKGTTVNGLTSWTATVACASQSANSIVVKATDAASNVSATKTITPYIDTIAPDTCEIVEVDGVAGFSGKKFVNKNLKKDVVFTVKTKDTAGGTGIKSVKLTRIGSNNISGIEVTTPSSTDNGYSSYKITLPYGQFKTGTVYVQATDKAGNANQEAALFQIEDDSTPPVIEIKSVTPCVHITEADGSVSHNLNGTVTVSASISDLNLKNVWYEVFENDSATAKTTVTDLGALYTFNQTIDTTGYADTNNIKVVIHAEDEAGNKSDANTTTYNGDVSYVVNQSTDKPVFTPSNYTERATAAAIESGDWFDNKGNNKLIASVSDDDGLAGLTVTVTKADGKELSPAINDAELPFTANSTSAAINYVLPSADGIYKVVFTATDNTYDGASAENKAYRTTQTSPFFVGVDTAAPTVSITSHGTGTNTVGSSLGLTEGKLVFSGKAADNNGISKIEIKASKAGSSDKTWTWERGAAVNAVTFTDGTWTKEFTVGSGKDLPDGEYTVSVTVTDPAGKTGSAERSFIIDTVKPVVNTAVVDTTKQTGSDIINGDTTLTWYKTSQIGIKTTTTDATSGEASVEYSTDNGTSWNSFTKGTTDANKETTWTAIASCSAQGSNSIKVRATDAAQNISEEKTITVYIDTNAPADCVLVSIDEDESFSGKKLVNKTKDVTFIVKPVDNTTAGDANYTGIAGVKLIRIGNGADWPADNQIAGTAVSGQDGQYSITIPKEELEAGTVWLTVTDKAGNEANFSAFPLELDVDAPDVAIAPISGVKTETDGILYVNKTITITGTGFDSRELNSVEVYYAIAAAKPALPAAADQGNSTKWTGWTKATLGGTMYNWSVDIETASSAANDGKNLYVCAVAKDSAENIKLYDYSTDYKTRNAEDTADINVILTINQDSDRPIIRLSNLELALKNNKYWHTSKELFGTVSDDDGTVKSVKYKIGAAGAWSSNIYENGMWTIDNIGADGAKEIYFEIVDASNTSFVSNANSLTAGSYGPKIKDSSDAEKLGYTDETKDDILKITVDTQSPTFGTPKAYVSASATLNAQERWENSINNTEIFKAIGGTNKYLYVKLIPSDDNGIASTAITLDGKEVSSTDDDAKVLQNNAEGVIVRYDLSKFETGSNKDLVIKVTDNAGKSTGESYKVNIDNSKPIVTYTTRDGSQMFSSVANTVQGKTSDENEVSELWYAITTSETPLTTEQLALAENQPAAENYEQITWTNAAENQISILNWSIYMDGSTTTKEEFHSRTLFSWYKQLTGKTDDQLGTDDSTKYIYVWTKAVDEVGNVSDPAPLRLDVALNGDKPTIEITYPSDEASVGGTIRITGTTQILTNSVSKVYVQIDPTYSTTFNNDGWKSELEALMAAKNIPSSYYEIVSTGKTAPYDYGILVSGTSGWSQSANDYGEFDPADKNALGKIAIRAFAVSSTGKVSAAVTHTVEIDPNTPLIGNKTPLQLIQYANEDGTPCTDGSKSSGTVAARMDYKQDMYIKGIWYLTGSLWDDSGIKSAIVTMSDETTKTVIDSGTPNTVSDVSVSVDTANAPTVVGTTCKNYDIFIKVGNNSASEFGTLTYKISILDNSNPSKGNDATISLRYDNNAPDFAVTSTSSGVADTVEFKQIYQNNGTYTVNGTFDEPGKTVGDISYNQAGFSRIVMYYTRTLNKGTPSEVSYLIDPMISSGSTGTANREAINSTNFVSATVNSTDGLFWRAAQGTVSNNILTVSSFKGSAYNSSTNPLAPLVRAGGLVKINNVIYRIKSVNDDSVAIDGTLQNIDTEVYVYFAAAALVIDNTVTETGTTSVYDPSKSNAEGKDHMSNGDGDQMIEGAVKNGTTYTWTASIDSSNILDGDVDVHFVAFDAAGNIKKDNTSLAGAKVANNAPRLAGVKYGTDVNGNGTVEDNELKTEYSNLYVNVQTPAGKFNGKKSDGSNVSELIVDEDDRLIVKGSMKVVPQIVGGNLGLGWKYSYQTAADGNAEKETAVTYYTGAGAQHSADGSIRNGTDGTNDAVYAINISTLALLKLDSNNGIKSGEQTMKFTVVDKTEGGSLSAAINLPVNILLADNVAPTAVFTPFYWTSKNKNSLYNNSRLNGHIELEGDLPEAFTTVGTGVMDRDPKVSGIISMDGVAEDNVLVKTIVVNVDGTNYTVAERGDNGAWTSENLLTIGEKTYDDYDFASKNWYFELVSDKFDDATGANTVTFRFHWNTAAMIFTVAKTNVAVKVTATDRGSISLNTAKTDLTYAAGKSSTPGTTQTTGAAGSDTNTGYYKMDVVPYITELITKLSSLESSTAQWAKTAYSRTALGYYPVAENEVIEVKGFNLGENTNYKPTVKIGNANLIQNATNVTASSIKDVPVGTSTSGTVTVTVNGVSSINNSNNGTVEYNIVDNGVNNATLNDNVDLKVWEFKTIATPEVAEYVTYPTVKINPVNGMIGASFSNDFYWHMAGFAENTQNVTPASVTNTNYGNWRTQTPFMKGYEGGDQNTFSFDSNGYTYGAVQWRNREKVAEGGYFNFYFSRAKTEENMSTANAYLCNSGSSRLEANCLNLLSSPSNEHKDSEWKTNNMRIKSPSIVAVPNGDSSNTTVHIAYFDSSTGQLRYRKGAVNAKDVNVQSDGDYANNASAAQSAFRLEGTNDSLKDVYDYIDYKKNWAGQYEVNNDIVYTGGSTRGEGGVNYPYSDTLSTDADGNYRADTNNDIGKRDKKPADSLQTHSDQIIHVIASNGVDGDVQDIYKKSHYTYGAGKYLSMGILSDKKTVVIAWYDEIAQKVYLTYGDTSATGDFKKYNTPIVDTKTHAATFENSYKRTDIWQNHTNEIGTGGAYVQMAVGTDNKIHIAYYDNVNGGVVKYVRGSINTSGNNNAQFTKEVDVIVDSHGDVGSELTLNIGKDSKGRTVPYIGYFSRNYAKVAYRVNFTESATETDISKKGVGAVDNIYTHNWEVSYVPSAKTLYGGEENRVNVAVWTKTNGDLGKAVSGKNTESKRNDKGTSWGKTDTAGSNSFANGTNNPIVAYVSSSGSLDYGQIKGDSTEITFKP